MALVALALPLVVVLADGRMWWIALTEWGPYPQYSEAPGWLPGWLAQSPEEWARAKARWEGLKGLPDAMPLVLFFMFLPALNAPFDWLSLAVSRTLLRWTAKAPRWLGWLSKIADLIERLPAVGWIPGRVVEFVVILVDAIIALILAGLIVFATAFGVAMLAKVHLLGGASGIGFIVSERIAEIRADPLAKENWWIYAMMFWTLVPTIVHIIVYAAGVTVDLISIFGGVRTWIAKWVEAGAGRLWPGLVRGGVLASLRLLPGLLVLVWLISYRDYTMQALGIPFELAGRLPGVDLACTEDFTVGTLGTCLADGSEALAKWVESW